MSINTITFSEFLNAGNLPTGATTVGLSSGTNAQFINPWVFLPPGSTADRPPITPSIYYLLRFNTDVQLYEYYNALTFTWVQITPSSTTFIWTEVSSNTSMVINHGYFTNSSSTLQLTLPVFSAVGNMISIAGIGSGLGQWQIKQNNLQKVTIGTMTSTPGIGGSVTSDNFSDSINLVCSVADTSWVAVGSPLSNGLTIL